MWGSTLPPAKLQVVSKWIGAALGDIRIAREIKFGIKERANNTVVDRSTIGGADQHTFSHYGARMAVMRQGYSRLACRLGDASTRQGQFAVLRLCRRTHSGARDLVTPRQRRCSERDMPDQRNSDADWSSPGSRIPDSGRVETRPGAAAQGVVQDS